MVNNIGVGLAHTAVVDAPFTPNVDIQICYR